MGGRMANYLEPVPRIGSDRFDSQRLTVFGQLLAQIHFLTVDLGCQRLLQNVPVEGLDRIREILPKKICPSSRKR